MGLEICSGCSRHESILSLFVCVGSVYSRPTVMASVQVCTGTYSNKVHTVSTVHTVHTVRCTVCTVSIFTCVHIVPCTYVPCTHNPARGKCTQKRTLTHHQRHTCVTCVHQTLTVTHIPPQCYFYNLWNCLKREETKAGSRKED